VKILQSGQTISLLLQSGMLRIRCEIHWIACCLSCFCHHLRCLRNNLREVLRAVRREDSLPHRFRKIPPVLAGPLDLLRGSRPSAFWRRPLWDGIPESGIQLALPLHTPPDFCAVWRDSLSPFFLSLFFLSPSIFTAPITIENHDVSQRYANIFVDYTRAKKDMGVVSVGSIHPTTGGVCLPVKKAPTELSLRGGNRDLDGL
jgi:hypothetical protein